MPTTTQSERNLFLSLIFPNLIIACLSQRSKSSRELVSIPARVQDHIDEVCLYLYDIPSDTPLRQYFQVVRASFGWAQAEYITEPRHDDDFHVSSCVLTFDCH